MRLESYIPFDEPKFLTNPVDFAGGDWHDGITRRNRMGRFTSCPRSRARCRSARMPMSATINGCCSELPDLTTRRLPSSVAFLGCRPGIELLPLVHIKDEALERGRRCAR